jgi:hypothetical protein
VNAESTQPPKENKTLNKVNIFPFFFSWLQFSLRFFSFSFNHIKVYINTYSLNTYSLTITTQFKFAVQVLWSSNKPCWNSFWKIRMLYNVQTSK